MRCASAVITLFTLHCAVHAEVIGEPKTFRGRIDGRRGSDQSYFVPGTIVTTSLNFGPYLCHTEVRLLLASESELT